MLGVGYVVAGQVSLFTIKRLGQRGHTSWSNLMNVCSNLVWAFDTGERGTIIGQIIMSLAHRKRDGLEAMIYRLGTSEHAANALAKQEKQTDNERAVDTWGRGEVSGWLANFKSVLWICAPQLYAFAYTIGTSNGRSFHGAFPTSPRIYGCCRNALR
eukprot:SAG31_NODE_191_length_20809_cov_64.613761_10_plen_157_part_00